MHRVPKTALVLLLLSGLAAALTGAILITQPSAPLELTMVQVLTDRLDPRHGAIIRMQAGSSQFVVVTNEDGQTPWVGLNPSAGVDIILAEQSQSGGTAIGLREFVLPPSLPNASDDVHYTEISRTQPLAVPVLVQGNQEATYNIFPPDGDYPHWSISVPQYSNLRFAASIASVLDRDTISQYMAYRGYTPDQTLHYVRGVAMVVPGVQLGVSGIVVGVRLLGDLNTGVVIDCYNFTTPPHVVPGGPSLAATICGVISDVVYVRVSGALAKGQLALLARAATGPPSQVVVTADNPIEITVPATGGSGTDVAGAISIEQEMSPAKEVVVGVASVPVPELLVTDCEPDVPDQTGFTCTPPAPTPTTCGSASGSAVECQVVRSRTAKMCRAPGATVGATTGRTREWKVSFELNVGGESWPINSGGGFTYGEASETVTSESWTAGAGAYGLGQCMRYFRFELVCAAAYTYLIDGIEVTEDGVITIPCAIPKTVASTCRDTNVSQSVCDRTP